MQGEGKGAPGKGAPFFCRRLTRNDADQEGDSKIARTAKIAWLDKPGPRFQTRRVSKMVGIPHYVRDFKNNPHYVRDYKNNSSSRRILLVMLNQLADSLCVILGVAIAGNGIGAA